MTDSFTTAVKVMACAFHFCNWFDGIVIAWKNLILLSRFELYPMFPFSCYCLLGPLFITFT